MRQYNLNAGIKCLKTIGREAVPPAASAPARSPRINAFYFPALLIAFSSCDLERASLLDFERVLQLFGVRYVISGFQQPSVRLKLKLTINAQTAISL